ncbi:MAG: GHKL domain-containing protein [Paenibacillaceae bacterium]|nr:GHKL domain-containing protein [Paenibacillaceae bacterium]
MLLLCFILVLVSVLLLRFNPNRQDVRWLVFFLLAWALGALGYFLEQEVSPPEASYAFWYSVRTWLKLLSDSASPYAFLLFAIVYADAAKGRWRRLWAFVLPLPPLYVYYLMPKHAVGESYNILSVYFVPYYAAGFVLLLAAWIRERNRTRKRERLATAALIVPPVLAYTWSDNYVKAIWSFHYYRYVPLLISAVLFLFVFALLASKHGVLGVRLILRRQIADQTRRGIASGTMMINHALKNHLTNIELLARDALHSGDGPDAEENMSLVLAEANQMKRLIVHIQKQVEDIRLTVADCDVAALVRAAAAAHQLALAKKGIRLSLDIPAGADLTLRADPVHLQEVFGNLIRNAVEAIQAEGGVIRIRLFELAGGIEIRITDNGPGIAATDADNIFDAFFSTKARTDNFGLGLSYCSAVVQKHAGTLEACSRPGEGATFVVRLPKRKRLSAGRTT